MCAGGNLVLLGVGICWNLGACEGRLQPIFFNEEFQQEKKETYAAGAGVAFATVDRLILRTRSCTLNFASAIEMGPAGATVDLHRTIAVFGAEGTRILLVVGNAMVLGWRNWRNV